MDRGGGRAIDHHHSLLSESGWAAVIGGLIKVIDEHRSRTVTVPGENSKGTVAADVLHRTLGYNLIVLGALSTLSYPILTTSGPESWSTEREKGARSTVSTELESQATLWLSPTLSAFGQEQVVHLQAPPFLVPSDHSNGAVP